MVPGPTHTVPTPNLTTPTPNSTSSRTHAIPALSNPFTDTSAYY